MSINAEISFYLSAKDKKPTKGITVKEFVEIIRAEKHSAGVARVRAAATEDEKRSIKLRLPAVQLSGLVTTGERAQAIQQGRFKHSGWLQLDVDSDDLGNYTPEQARALLGGDRHVLSAFITPSGEGAKALFRIKPCLTEDEHKTAWYAAEKYISDTYGLKIDKSTKDPGRLCFLSADKDCTWQPFAEEFVLPEAAASQKSQKSQKTSKTSKSFKMGANVGIEEPPQHGIHDWLLNSIRHCEQHGLPKEYTAAKFKAYDGTLRRPFQPTEVDDACRDIYATPSKSADPADSTCEAELEEELTPFPTHCLPGAAGDMAREIGRVTTAQNEPLAAASVIAILSAAIGAGIEVSTGGERWTRGNLFTLAIAESGTGKGEAYKLAADPFEILEAEEIEDFDMHTKPGLLAELSVADKRAKSLCNQAAKETDSHARIGSLMEYRRAEEERADIQRRIDAAPRWKVADVTREALAVVLAGQPGEAVASLSSEARGIFSIVKGRYGKEGGDEDLYCSAYSGDSINIDRVGRPRITLRRPCLSILWMVQPDAARKAFNEESFTDSGLLPRFLIFDPKAEPQERYEQPSPIPVSIKNGWAMLIRSLATTYRMNGDNPQAVRVSKDATNALTDYERENVRRRRRNGDLIDLAPFVARWTENAWKIALVLHAAQHGGTSHEVTLDATTAGNALEVMRWFADRQLETLSAGRRDKLKKRLMALMAAMTAANGEITFRDLKRTHSFEEAEIRKLQAAFPKAFKIEERRSGAIRNSYVVIGL